MGFFFTTRAADTFACRYKPLSIICARRRRLRAAHAELETVISVALVTSPQPRFEVLWPFTGLMDREISSMIDRPVSMR